MSTLSFLTRRSTTELAPPPPNEETLKHVAICGVSYCGSTLFARILGSLPGVANIGESHWLLNRRDNGVTVAADPRNEDWTVQVHCSKCGRNCEYLDRDFRIALMADRKHWYHRIAAHLDTDILVSADKNHDKIVGADPLLRLDALVLFKNPRWAAYSHFRHRRRKGAPEATARHVTKYLDKWAHAYKVLLDRLDVQGRKVAMGWGDFCSDPAERLEALCRALGLPYDAGVLERIDPEQHCLGGNVSVNQHFRQDAAFAVRPPPELSMSEEHEEAIAGHRRSARVFERLRELQRSTLG